MANKIEIKPIMYEWAIEESQLPYGEIEQRFPMISQWINQSQAPTFKQLKKFADFLHIPFGYLFLSTPPVKEDLHAEFRAISNKKPTISKNLEDTLMEMTIKQNWMSEYRKSQGYSAVDFIGKYKNSSPSEIIHATYELLDIKDFWSETAKSYDEAYAILRKKIERTGVLVMQNGIVGSNTKRKLDVKEFRGFLLVDNFAPLIFINKNDSKAAKNFTLIHELIHLLVGEADILTSDVDNQDYHQIESKINNITAEILIPDNFINNITITPDNFLSQVHKYANILKVSTFSLGIKLLKKDLIDSAQLESIKKESIENFERSLVKDKRGSPDFYRVLNSRLSQAFSEAVISQTLIGLTTFTEAYRLLGIRGDTFENFKEHFFEYA